MMAATGVLSLGEATFSLKPSHISEFFVALYVLLFAAVWFLFEISQIRPIAAVHDLLRRNFGFLFSPIGKCSFIVFIAFLNFGVAVNAKKLMFGCGPRKSAARRTSISGTTLTSSVWRRLPAVRRP